MAVDRYSFQISGGLMDGDTALRLIEGGIANKHGYDFEDYWHRFEVPGATGSTPSEVTIEADILDNARILIVLGGPDVAVLLGDTGMEEIPCDPFLVVSDEGNGTGYSKITVVNNGAADQKVTVIACAFKD